MPYTKRTITPGQKFTDWTVIRETRGHRTPDGTHKRIVRVRCACGLVKDVQVNNLVTGASRRCVDCAAIVRGKMRQLSPDRDGITNKRGAYGRYRIGAKKRNLAFDLDFDAFLEITAQPCRYCGRAPSNRYDLKFARGPKKGQPRGGQAFIHNGVDRIDSTQGYSRDNCVPCCRRCNVAKSDMTVSEFYQWVGTVQQHMTTTGTTDNGTPLSPRTVQREKVGRRN